MPRLKRIEFFSLAHQRHSSAGGSGPSGGWRLTQVSEVTRKSDPTSQKRDVGHPVLGSVRCGPPAVTDSRPLRL
jgi:hypothetical protein